MKADLTFPPEMIRAIADEVAALLKPMLVSEPEIQDPIFTQEQLAVYLQVTERWVYERTRFNEIPFFKAGRLNRFRKSEIDRWIQGQSSPATAPAPSRIKIVR